VRIENQEGKIGKKNKVGFLDSFFGQLDDFSTRQSKNQSI
jgi:hypothetical protein